MLFMAIRNKLLDIDLLKNTWKMNKSLFHQFMIEQNFYNEMLQNLNFGHFSV